MFPNLPENRINEIIIGEKYHSLLIKPLSELNIEPILIPDNPYVDKKINGHVDLSVVQYMHDKIILSPFLKKYDNLIEKLNGKGYKIVFSNRQENKYPDDSNLNACFFKDKVIYNPKTIDKILTEAIEENNYLKIKCNQGYARCSVAVIDNESIMTSDKGIYKSAMKSGLDVLLLKENLIELPGYNCGFIGGSTFKISKTELAFTGVITDKKENNKIKSFLQNKGIEVVYLSNKKIFDIGGAIPLECCNE